MNRASFEQLYIFIQDDPVFQNNSISPQVSPKYQLAVTMSRFGHDGNGAAIQNQRLMFSMSGAYTRSSTLCSNHVLT